MKARITISGDLRAMLAEETALAAKAVRSGVESAGRRVQQELRDQVASAGFASSRSLSNAWRLKVYPLGGGATLHPAALIWTQAADIIDAFERGVSIRANRTPYLCWPTPLNAARGRRTAGGRGGMRVTPQDMLAAKGNAVVLSTKRAGLKLWCLRVRKEQNRTKTGRAGKVRLFVHGANVEILTGRIKAADRNAKIDALLKRGYAAMFFLSKSVNPRKRLDVAGVFSRADAVLETSLRAALAA